VEDQTLLAVHHFLISHFAKEKLTDRRLLDHPFLFVKTNYYHSFRVMKERTVLTLILLTWRIWWAPNKASRWQMGFNSAFKGL